MTNTGITDVITTIATITGDANIPVNIHAITLLRTAIMILVCFYAFMTMTGADITTIAIDTTAIQNTGRTAGGAALTVFVKDTVSSDTHTPGNH